MGEFDVTSSAVALGTGVVIDRGYLPSSGGGANRTTGVNNVFSNRPLVNSFDGTTPDTLTIAIRTFSGTGNAYGTITWFGAW
jgi:hypothetical protein